MSKANTKESTFRLVGVGILTAIIVVLQVITTYFPTKPFAITLALIPIIVGAAMYGKGAGAWLGAVFSIVVIIMCIAGVDVGGAMVWNANPFMCVVICMLKGTAAGFVAGLIYKALEKVNTILATVLAAIAAPVVNTGIFMIGLGLFFRETFNTFYGSNDVFFVLLTTLVGVNFLIELGVNVVASPIIVKIIEAVKKSTK